MTNHGGEEAISLADRLDLLETSGVITSEARRITDEAITRIEDLLKVTLDDKSGGPLVTHIAVALSRVERDEPAPDLPDVVAAELASRPEEVRMAEGLAQDWQAALGAPIPPREVSYIAAHLAALRDQDAAR